MQSHIYMTYICSYVCLHLIYLINMQDPLVVEVTNNPGTLTRQLRNTLSQINSERGISPYNLLQAVGTK